jgi:2-oxoglutarate ferredoxin oxidoreductase subunit alpha
MQARWGTHGDHPVIVLAPASVREIYTQAIRAFNFSEAYRVPVVLLYDEVVGHLVETVELLPADAVEIISRPWATGPRENYRPYATAAGDIPAMARPGDGYRSHTTGLTHDETGFPTQDPQRVGRIMERLLGKIDRHRAEIEQYEQRHCADAEVLVVAYGITARAAERAVKQARQGGVKAGLLRPITLWPFPERAFQNIARSARHVLVPEMNAGQLCLEIERLCPAGATVVPLNRVDGEPIPPVEILSAIEKLVQLPAAASG